MVLRRLIFSLLSCHLAYSVLGEDSDPQASPSVLPHWIGASAESLAEMRIYFREMVSVPPGTKRAVLIAAGDEQIEVFVNGSRRAVKSAHWSKPVVEDITDQVKKGKLNLLAGRVTNQKSAAAFFVLVEFTLEDGTKSWVTSSAGWSVTSESRKGWNQPEFVEPGDRWMPGVSLGELGSNPWDEISGESIAELLNLRVPTATPVERIRLQEGFSAELLYSVPKAEQGSWVAMTIDNDQRLIVSDQYGALYRVPVPPPGEQVDPKLIEKVPVDIGGAQGLLYAFDSLYAVLNTPKHGGRGLYRITDSNGDDEFDRKELLRKFDDVGGEHGPHSVTLGPDGKSLYVVVGNQTPLTQVDSTLIPPLWGEDLLLPRPIGKGFMKGTLAPGGWIAKTDLEGKHWELVATGFRNPYDLAFNRNGDLFTFDADMEWDMNTPWYRPTRVNHVVSGAEFGWRHGGGKWPAHYADSLPAVIDIGPGSPTGVSFGYGAKFPRRYEEALFVADWSYGKLYTVHLSPSGGTYKAQLEEFMSAQPLPLTDMLVNPEDGALYLTIGGRRVQSGLYRVTYGRDFSKVGRTDQKPELHRVREQIEKFHRPDPKAIEFVWPYLSHEDRFIRYAARIAVEHQPVGEWKRKALVERDIEAKIQASIALSRVRVDGVQNSLLSGLNQISMDELSNRQKLDLFRAYSLAFTRLGAGERGQRERAASLIVAGMPYATPVLNREALQLAVFLEHPEAARIGVELLSSAPSQEEQVSYATSLRHLKEGWNRELRKEYFEWFTRAATFKGGASFGLYIQGMKQDALANTPVEEKMALRSTIEAKPQGELRFTTEPRSFVKAWTAEDFDDVIHVGLEGNRDFENGRRMFGATTCFACHRFNQEGGAIGPDLTSVAGKFSPRDLLESIVDPSKEISDQYGQMIFTMKDGSIVMGRIINLSGDSVRVNTNMMDPNEIVVVDRKRLVSMKKSPLSMMPAGLLNSLEKDDVLDLLAYLLTKGDKADPMFAE